MMGFYKSYWQRCFTFLFFINFTYYSAQNQKIFFTVESDSELQRNFLERNPEMEEMHIFYQPEFAPDEILQPEMLEKFIELKIPNKNAEGYAVLDWEGIKEEALNNQKDDKEFHSAQNEFLTALRLAKKLRPYIKWSFYGFPTANFWSPDTAWQKRNERFAKLFSAMDFFAPSLYLFYSPEEYDPKLTVRYLNTNLRLALSIGEKYGKEVYPFIMHRYHPSSKISGVRLIPEKIFRPYIQRIKEYEGNRNSVNGIIWWHAENYYHNNQSLYPNITAEVKENRQNQNDIFTHYWNIIKPIFYSKKISGKTVNNP